MGGKTQERLPREPITGKEPAIYSSLKGSDDARVLAARWRCVNDNIHSLIDGLAIRGDTEPTRHDYCELAVVEAEGRGTLNALYLKFSPADPNITWAQIGRAAVARQNSWIDSEGEQHAMTCPLGFEVGFKAGLDNPNRRFAPDVSNARIEELREECFKEGSRVSRADGIAIGARRAQRRLELAEAENGTDKVPSVGKTELASAAAAARR